MSTRTELDAWSAGESYEHYMGRWSRNIAARFVDWLAPPTDLDWLELGCGTGALTQTVLAKTAPRSILATDQSADFVTHARAETSDPRARFDVADALNLPAADRSVDIVTSALVLNFIPDKEKALREMQRVLRLGGCLSFYVWDYPGGGMGFIDAFWKAAAEIDPAAKDMDESARFPFCQAIGLNALCRSAGVENAEIAALEVETKFPDFEAFWHPFTLGAGPAPGYCNSLPKDQSAALKAHLAAKIGTGGPVVLPARAWAVKAVLE